MEQPAIFARHLARLVSLLIHESGNVDDQKATLRALVVASKNGPVVIAGQGWDLFANDEQIPSALPGARDVAERLTAHAIPEIRFDADSNAADLLGVARILAADAVPGDGGARARQKFEALNPRTIVLPPLHPDPSLAPAPVDERADEAATAVPP